MKMSREKEPHPTNGRDSNIFVGRVTGHKRKVNNKGTCGKEINKARCIGDRREKRGSFSLLCTKRKSQGGWREKFTGIRESDGRNSYLTASVFLMIRVGVHFSGLITRCQNRDFRETVEI